MIVTRGLLSPVTNLVMKGLAARYPQSVRFTVVAWILTNTSFARGTGASTSRIRTTSGAPYLVCTAALTNERLATRQPAVVGPQSRLR